jgi:hypothetical protein
MRTRYTTVFDIKNVLISGAVNGIVGATGGIVDTRWSTETMPVMGLFLVNEANEAEYMDRMDAVRRTAMHEFGHVLGQFDAYENAPFTWEGAKPDVRAIGNDVMYSRSIQTVYNYNIGMMLYAFRDSVLQNYGNKAIVGTLSEVYFRNSSLE